jgi:AraC-like DNA-binding protein
VRAAADADDYASDPTGAYLAGAHALVFCARPTLWGFAVWGSPAKTDLDRLVTLLRRELAGDVVPHASLIDARHLATVDPRAFAVLAKYLRANFALFTKRVSRLALVRPPGLLGATVAGFYQVAGAPYPVRVFDDLAAATAWLRVPALARELDAAITAASALSPTLVALRRWLDGHLDDASLARASKSLGRAARSLQRDLTAHDTSFQAELDAARTRLARRLLAESDSSLTEIAYDVGCASPQHFSTLFKRVTGQSPSAFRLSASRARSRSATTAPAPVDADVDAGARDRRRRAGSRPRRPRAT